MESAPADSFILTYPIDFITCTGLQGLPKFVSLISDQAFIEPKNSATNRVRVRSK